MGKRCPENFRRHIWEMMEGLMPYEYQVREIQAPEGFCLDHRVWKFWFSNDHTPVAVQKIKAENEETRLWFSKSSFHTDHFVKGARLSIYNAKAENGKMQPWGEPLETWILRSGAPPGIGKIIRRKNVLPCGGGSARGILRSGSGDVYRIG